MYFGSNDVLIDSILYEQTNKLKSEYMHAVWWAFVLVHLFAQLSSLHETDATDRETRFHTLKYLFNLSLDCILLYSDVCVKLSNGQREVSGLLQASMALAKGQKAKRSPHT
jgi:hypothetical protein